MNKLLSRKSGVSSGANSDRVRVEDCEDNITERRGTMSSTIGMATDPLKRRQRDQKVIGLGGKVLFGLCIYCIVCYERSYLMIICN